MKIEARWRERLRPQSADEQELLGYVHNADVDSRLACQIRLTEALDGLEARVAGSS